MCHQRARLGSCECNCLTSSCVCMVQLGCEMQKNKLMLSSAEIAKSMQKFRFTLVEHLGPMPYPSLLFFSLVVFGNIGHKSCCVLPYVTDDTDIQGWNQACYKGCLVLTNITCSTTFPSKRVCFHH